MPGPLGSLGNYFLLDCAPLWLQLEADVLRHDLIDVLSFPSNFWGGLAATQLGMVASQSSLSAVRLRPVSKPHASQDTGNKISCLRAWHNDCKSQAGIPPQTCCSIAHLPQPTVLMSFPSCGFSLQGKTRLRQSLSHFCVLNLPCSCSSAYLCRKLKLEKLRGRQNLTLMPVVLLLLAGICLPLMYVLDFFLPFGDMSTLKWFLQNSCCWDAAARVEAWV